MVILSDSWWQLETEFLLLVGVRASFDNIIVLRHHMAPSFEYGLTVKLQQVFGNIDHKDSVNSVVGQISHGNDRGCSVIIGE